MSTLLSSRRRHFFAALAGTTLLLPATVQAAPEIVVLAPHELQNNAPIGMAATYSAGLANFTTQTVTIRNTGTDPLTGVAATVSGSGFILNSLPAATVAAGGSTSFVVKFTPSYTETFTGTLTMWSDDADENPFRLTLKGCGKAYNPFVMSSPLTVYNTATGDCLSGAATVEFGTVPVGTAVDRTFTVVNGTSQTRGGIFVSYDPWSRSQFQILSRPATSLASGSSTQFTLRCLPTAVGVVSEDWALNETITSGGPPLPPTTTYLTASGLTLRATVTGPEIEVLLPSGAIVDDNTYAGFGRQPLGQPVSRILTVRNTGTAPLTGLTASTVGVDAGDFVVTGQPATTVAPGGSTTLTVTFSPSGLRWREAWLHIASNDYDENPFDVKLIGSGPVPAMVVEDGAGVALADNAAVALGTSSTGSVTSRTFTLRNTGDADLTGLMLTLAGAQAGSFAVVPRPAALMPVGGSVVFVVEFSPLAAGSHVAALQISSPELLAIFDLNLSATVAGPEISVETAEGAALSHGSAAVQFGGVLAGTTASRMFTLRNSGNEPLTNLAFTVTGPHAADFGVVQDDEGTQLAAGGSLAWEVQFSPGAIGPRHATLSIASNDADENPFVLALAGTWAGGPAQDFSLGRGTGTDGQLTVAMASETSTVRAALTETAVAGALVLPMSSSAGFSAGQMIVVLQMTGIKAGHYEEARVAGVAENSLTLQGPLRNTFPVSPRDAAQVLAIPQYSDVTILPGATLTCPPWNGSTGGVLWIKVAGTLQNDGTVDVSGKGFAGGASVIGGAGGAGGAGGRAGQPAGGGFTGGAGASVPGGSAGASGPAMLAGAGGASGHAGQGGAGAGGGARGVSNGNSAGLADGSAGGPGGHGGTGAAGGQGGGITFISARRLAGGGLFKADGRLGENGTDGLSGAAGGNGGTGSAAFTTPDLINGPPNLIQVAAGAGGAGGRGGEGGHAGAGGEGGDGGFILIQATASSFTGTGSRQGGISGSAGAVGAGGAGGRYGGSATLAPGGPAGLSTAPATDGSEGTFQISIVLESYALWSGRHFSAAELSDAALSGALADADGDGTSNLLEFASNLHPRTADRRSLTPGTSLSGLPVARVAETPAGPLLTLEFLRRKAGTQPGISYQAQFAGDLAAWESGAEEVVTSIDETWERVIASDPALAGAARRFARLAVSVLP